MSNKTKFANLLIFLTAETFKKHVLKDSVCQTLHQVLPSRSQREKSLKTNFYNSTITNVQSAAATGETRHLREFWNSQEELHRGIEVYAGSQRGSFQKDKRREGESHPGQWKQGQSREL